MKIHTEFVEFCKSSPSVDLTSYFRKNMIHRFSKWNLLILGANFCIVPIDAKLFQIPQKSQAADMTF